MSVENAAKFLNLVSEDKGLEEKLGSASGDEVLEMAKSKGLDMTMDEFKQVIDVTKALKPGEELSEEDLEQVAGGFAICTAIAVTAGVTTFACAVDEYADKKGWW